MNNEAMISEILSSKYWNVHYEHNSLFLVPFYDAKELLAIINKNSLLKVLLDNIPNEKISTIALELSELVKSENKQKVIYFALKKYNDVAHKKMQKFLDHLDIHHLAKFLLIETE